MAVAVVKRNVVRRVRREREGAVEVERIEGRGLRGGEGGRLRTAAPRPEPGANASMSILDALGSESGPNSGLGRANKQSSDVVY